MVFIKRTTSSSIVQTVCSVTLLYIVLKFNPIFCNELKNHPQAFRYNGICSQCQALDFSLCSPLRLSLLE